MNTRLLLNYSKLPFTSRSIQSHHSWVRPRELNLFFRATTRRGEIRADVTWRACSRLTAVRWIRRIWHKTGGFTRPTLIAPPVRARYCDADERIIEGIARWLSEHSVGPPRRSSTPPERQILLFHGIVNSRQRVLMPVPSRGGTHEISVLRLSPDSSVLLRAVIHRRVARLAPPYTLAS